MAVAVKVTGEGGEVLFEAEPSPSDLAEIGLFDKATDVVRDAGTTFATVATTLRHCVDEVLSTVEAISAPPSSGRALSSVELEVGVKITAAGNVVVAKGTAEANLTVMFTWTFP